MSSVQTELAPLVAGDKLTLDEFLERWEAMPELKFAELIGGIVYMPSPVSINHGSGEEVVGTWLGVYWAHTPGTSSAGHATTILGGDSPQPDKNLRLLPEVGGRTWVERKFLHGAPEFISEVCISSTAYDLNQKKDLYRDNEVYEYLAVLMHETEIRWHRLVDGEYELMPPDADGIWRSQVFPGLWLDGAALLEGNLPRVLEVLQQGMDSAEYGAFVAELAKRKSQDDGK